MALTKAVRKEHLSLLGNCEHFRFFDHNFPDKENSRCVSWKQRLDYEIHLQVEILYSHQTIPLVLFYPGLLSPLLQPAFL